MPFSHKEAVAVVVVAPSVPAERTVRLNNSPTVLLARPSLAKPTVLEVISTTEPTVLDVRSSSAPTVLEVISKMEPTEVELSGELYIIPLCCRINDTSLGSSKPTVRVQSSEITCIKKRSKVTFFEELCWQQMNCAFI